jgi:O-antigen biosynthesis protein
VSQSLRVASIHFAAMVDGVLWRALRGAAMLRGPAPWLAKRLRQCVLLLWWTLSFQLHTHIRFFLRARRLREILPPAPPPLPPVVERLDPLSIVVPQSGFPVVSIIVPTYGQVEFTLRCLESIVAHMPTAPIEIIVVDDAWPGGDTELRLVRGIRVIRNETNLGYLRSCNAAAATARGEYLYLLNNDTQVLAGWLDPMLALAERSNVGAVGAKLLYPDGSLQEAGGIIWRDASGWNFGRHENAAKPVYNYVREADYCSAAALMVKRSVFLGMGGFDERYVPAYFEDTDLCFRLRRMGLKTLYQPRSQVVHHEGISHGRDTAVGIKSYQVANRRRFIAAWAPVLAAQHFPNGQNVFRARDRAMGRTVVLVVDHYVPQPDRDAGSRIMMSFLRILLRAELVVKFWPHNLSYTPGYTDLLQEMGVEVFHGPTQAPFAEWIDQVGGELDCVLISRPDVAEDVLQPIRKHSKARVVYFGHDLHFRRMRLQGEVTADARMLRAADRMEQRERAIWQQVDLALYPSEEEADIASALQPACRIRPIVPYEFARFGAARAAPACLEIVFVAGFGHPPNEDAACWFVAEVLPLVLAQVPGAHLSIIGSNPTAAVQGLAEDRVAVFANVSDQELAAAYARARVAVVPLRYGAGVKLKVVEALCEGVPLVTTPVGAQGLPGIWQVVAVADEPAPFAAAVVALLTDDAAWAERCEAQLVFGQARFSGDAMEVALLDALGVVPRMAVPHGQAA